MWWKKKGKEETEKVISYLRSRLFPWNFIFETVDEAAVAHFVPYAILMCEAKGIERGSVSVEQVKEVITQEVKESVEDYLFDPDDKEMIRMHGKFAATYPFAFSHCLTHAILYRLGLRMGDVVDVKAISDLLGRDMEEIKERESYVRDLISRNGHRAMKMFATSILNKKVITAGGDCIGTVNDLLFADDTGKLEKLVVNHLRSTGLKKGPISIADVRLNMYSKNIVLKSTTYKK